MEGVFQRILHVDLNKGLIGEERLPGRWYRDYAGGLGVGIRYLLEDLRSKKPLLDDPIIVMTGPLTGYPIPGTSRAAVISHRKEDRQLRLGSIHGKFPAYVKMAGFDGFVITGKSRGPVGLYFSSKSSRIADASALWGKAASEIGKAEGENSPERSVLAIGPAGENGHPYANVIADGWMYGACGLGQDLGGKRVKAVFVEPDSELPGDLDTRAIPEWAASYLEKHSRRIEPAQTRRSCFGCVGCCGMFHEPTALLVVEEEFERLPALLPQWPNDLLFLFYRECLNLGLEPLAAAKRFGRLGPPQDIHKKLEEFTRQPLPADLEEGIGNRSWEEAFLSLRGWYRDTVYRDVEDVPGLVEKENWALIKNCLPICERWDMDPEEMVRFFNRVTGSNDSSQDLLKRSEVLMDQIMDLYRSLNYIPLGPQGIRFWNAQFPSILRVGLKEYFRGRRWEDSGFPEKHEI